MKFYQVKTSRTTRFEIRTGRFSLRELPRSRFAMWCMIAAIDEAPRTASAPHIHTEEAA